MIRAAAGCALVRFFPPGAEACAGHAGMFRGAATLAAPLLPHWQESGWELPMTEQTSTPHGCFTPFSDMRWHSLRDPSGK